MAGAGFKTFNTGDVFTASDANTYLMQQTVMVFADAAARTTALGANVAEGMMSYLKDTNAVEVYNGSSWVASDDPNAIQNTIVDAKGDLISATAADTPARLAVGSNGEMLVADSSTSTGLRWQEFNAAGKNKIINGACQIDQRNGGAAIASLGSGTTYTIDRFYYYGSAAGKFSFQQNQGSVTPPAGFSKYMGFTSLSAYSLGAGDQLVIKQSIEGQNIGDLAWGTASAKTITLSFWVRSSLTGTFGGALQNDAQNRNYPFSYTISAANTWEKKSITVTGDTTGTWLTTNGIGINVTFSLGTGTTYSGTAGAWSGSSYLTSVTGAVNVAGTNGATWYATGIQVEAGSVATPFATATGTIQGELAACQRYYYRQTAAAAYAVFGTGQCGSSTTAQMGVKLPVTMRTYPTTLEYSTLRLSDESAGYTVTGLTFNSSFYSTDYPILSATVASGLTAQRFYSIGANNSTSAYIGIGAEL